MNWKNIEYNDNNSISIPDSWLDVHYYEALNMLFRFENSLRVFVYVILKNELKEDWDKTNIRDDNTIKKIAGIRSSQAKDYGYLCYDIKSPMLYLSSGDLIDLIMNDKNWKYFKKYFKAKKEIIKHKLLEIGAIRNSLAHFRPIHREDLGVIKQNLKHTLSIVEECLNNITSIGNIIPTNITEDWYLKLKGLKSKNLRLLIYQDNKEDWVKMSIEVIGVTLNKGYTTDIYKSFSVYKLSTINMLNKYKIIKNNITYVNESFTQQINIDELIYSKYINLVISKKNIKENITIIISELENLYSTIDNEIELLSRDNLAKGEIISSVHINCNLNEDKTYWNINVDNLTDSIDKFEGSEFWGQSLFNFMQEYITTLHQYPWMPTNISKSNGYF